MKGPDSVSPFQAILAAKALDPYRKQGGTIPRRPHDPPGTGSFKRFVHTVGYAIDLFLDPCQIDPWMLVETSIAAFIRAAYAVAFPDPKEFFHIVAGKSVVCTLKSEINEAGTFERLGWDGAKKTLFRIAEVADLSIWRLFLGSVIADGLVDWQTAAQEFSGCSGGRRLNSSTTADGAMPAANSTNPGNGLEWWGGDPGPKFTPSIVVKPGDTGYIVWHAEVGVPPTYIPYPIAVWIEEFFTGAIVSEVLTSIDLGGGVFKPPIMHYQHVNRDEVNHTFILRGKGLLPAPDGQLFFIKGYCATHGSV